jgi:predicted RNase H-like nuclease (RuvC/YqgF family)
MDNSSKFRIRKFFFFFAFSLLLGDINFVHCSLNNSDDGKDGKILKILAKHNPNIKSKKLLKEAYSTGSNLNIQLKYIIDAEAMKEANKKLSTTLKSLQNTIKTLREENKQQKRQKQFIRGENIDMYNDMENQKKVLELQVATLTQANEELKEALDKSQMRIRLLKRKINGKKKVTISSPIGLTNYSIENSGIFTFREDCKEEHNLSDVK